NCRKSAPLLSGKSPPAQPTLSSLQSQPRQFACAPPTTTPTSPAPSAAANPSTSNPCSLISTPSATLRPTLSKCPASTPFAVASSMSIPPKPIAPCASNSSATKPIPSANSIPLLNVLPIPSTKPCFSRSPKLRS